MVQQAIEDCAGERVVADELAPFTETLVARQNDGTALVPLAHEPEEVPCGLVIERLVADLVDNEQFCAIGREPFEMQPRAGAEFCEELLCGREMHHLTGGDRGVSETRAQMRFAAAGWPEKDHVLPVTQEAAACADRAPCLRQAAAGSRNRTGRWS